MKLALDAMPLIYLSRAGFFERVAVERLNLELFTSPEIAREVLLPEFSEYASLKKLFEGGKVAEVKSRRSSGSFQGLHQADASVVLLAGELGAALVSDDKAVRAVAQAEGVEVFHSTFFLYRALARKLVSREEAIGFLDEMVSSGWRCSAQAYALIREDFEQSGK